MYLPFFRSFYYVFLSVPDLCIYLYCLLFFIYLFISLLLIPTHYYAYLPTFPIYFLTSLPPFIQFYFMPSLFCFLVYFFLRPFDRFFLLKSSCL